MITIDDPDLEAMLRVIERETGEPPATVLRRAMARAFGGGADASGRLRPDLAPAFHVPPPPPGAPSAAANGTERPSPWTLLAELAGSAEMPPDWSAAHDHYLYGVPKRASDA